MPPPVDAQELHDRLQSGETLDDFNLEMLELGAEPDFSSATPPMTQALAELRDLWPRLDPYLQEGFKDFFNRWTHSWVNYFPALSKPEQV